MAVSAMLSNWMGKATWSAWNLPDGNRLTFVYDEYARLLEEVDSLDCKITYKYHHLTTLVTQLSYPNGSTWKARYDDKVNLLAEFDALGLRQWCDQEYACDPWDSLIERRTGLRKLQSFSYDAENRLVKAETLVNGKLHSTGTYRHDSLGRRIAKTSMFNDYTDQIGTPLEMTDADGSIVWQATYKAWGWLETLHVGEVEQDLRFQSQYFDD